MMTKQAAKLSHTRNAGHDRLQRPRPRRSTCWPSRRSPAPTKTAGRLRASQVPAWLAVGKVVVWVCVVVLIEVAVGHALQLAAENTASRADASELAPPMDILYARGFCPALDQLRAPPL